MAENIIEILPNPFNLELEIVKARQISCSSSLEALYQIAVRYPETKFYRRKDNKIFTSYQITAAYNQHVDFR